MYVLIATTALVLLTLYGPLPSASSPEVTAAVYGGLFLVFGCVRIGLGRWHRGTSKARFTQELGALREGARLLAQRSEDFASHHRPSPQMEGAVATVDALLHRLNEPDPLLLWFHLEGQWHTRSTAQTLERFTAELETPGDAPMDFKTQVQLRREAEVSSTSRALIETLERVELQARRHHRQKVDTLRHLLWLAAVLPAMWAIKVTF